MFTTNNEFFQHSSSEVINLNQSITDKMQPEPLCNDTVACGFVATETKYGNMSHLTPNGSP